MTYDIHYDMSVYMGIDGLRPEGREVAWKKLESLRDLPADPTERQGIRRLRKLEPTDVELYTLDIIDPDIFAFFQVNEADRRVEVGGLANREFIRIFKSRAANPPVTS